MQKILDKTIDNLFDMLNSAESDANSFRLEAAAEKREEEFYESCITPIFKEDFQKGNVVEDAYLAVIDATQRKAFSVGFKAACRFIGVMFSE